MKTTLVIVGMLVALIVVGCAPQEKVPVSTPVTDNAVNDVGGDLSDMDGLAADLDTSDLDTLNQELADIENLELQ